MSSGQWNRDEFLVTLDLYLNEEGFIEDENDPHIKQMASLINRSPGAVSLRLANYRHLDPQGTEGMKNTGQHCKEIWEEFYGNEEELSREAENARKRLSGDSKSSKEVEKDFDIETKEKSGKSSVRYGQSDFRKVIRNRYEDTCLLCDISRPGLLQAGHILEWSNYEDERGNPENGILLCYNHHRAFDLEFFTISSDYELVVRPDLDLESEHLEKSLNQKDGKKIRFPGKKPSSEVLYKRNKEEVYWWPPDRS